MMTAAERQARYRARNRYRSESLPDRCVVMVCAGRTVYHLSPSAAPQALCGNSVDTEATPNPWGRWCVTCLGQAALSTGLAESVIDAARGLSQ